MADTQADYAYNATIDSLDKMSDAYEDEKNQEIKILENTISSYQKLYDMAIDRISSSWDTLYQDLINWNYTAGNSVDTEITSAWDNASIAVQRYGSYLESVANIQSQLSAMTSGVTSTISSSNVVGNVSSSTQTDTRATLAKEVESLIAKLKSMSAQWLVSDVATQTSLAAQGKVIGQQISALLGRTVVRDEASGIWYLDKIGGEKMYDVYNSQGVNALFKYHTGGIAGDVTTKKDDEVFALLKKGELILDDSKKESVYSAIDWSSYMVEKFGGLADKFSSSFPNANMFNIVDNLKSFTLPNTEGVANSNNIDFSVDVHIDNEIDSSTARRIGKDIGESALERLQNGFTRRGMNNLTGSILRA